MNVSYKTLLINKFWIWFGCFFLSGIAFATPKFQLEVLTEELQAPWSIAVINETELLITEREGTLRYWDGELSEAIKGVPEVFFKGQGGLLDVVLHPKYAQNQWVYLTYASGDAQNNALEIVRGKLDKSGPIPELLESEVVFTVTPTKDTPVHCGGRLAFLPDGTFLVTSGDGFDYRESAQVGDSLLGKVLRLNADGTIPTDNPFLSNDSVHDAVYSLGHRNPQALLYDPRRATIFSNEHGPAGGDEINIIEAGKNYGWPVITNGKDYSGANISPFKSYPGMEQPFVDWTPSIAPSSMALYSGELFPELQGDLLVTALKSQELLWVDLDGLKVNAQKSLLPDNPERWRDVKVTPLGHILLISDGGKLLKLSK